MDQKPVVILTGASRGLGASVARWLGRAGTRLCLVARDEEKLAAVAEKVRNHGGFPLEVPADVAVWEQCHGVIGKTLERFGRIDALVNNAGIFEPLAPVAHADPAAWLYNIQVNLLGPFHMVKAALEPLRKGTGRVVNVSSGAARHPIHGGSAYCAAKAGLTHFTAVLAAEEPAVTAVAVRPGVVDTDMQVLLRREGPKAMPPEEAAYYERLKTEGLLENPDVPARSIAWLALKAPASWSGRFLDYDDPNITGPAKDYFGRQVNVT
jgi:NAD(P)-dependent dehydrogenase (short-subunit alcohol dehydrogenase family)